MKQLSATAGTILVLLAVASSFPALGQDAPEPLDEELAAILAELEMPQYTDDPFAQGRIPDLVIVSSTDVRGEVAPCG